MVFHARCHAQLFQSPMRLSTIPNFRLTDMQTWVSEERSPKPLQPTRHRHEQLRSHESSQGVGDQIQHLVQPWKRKTLTGTRSDAMCGKTLTPAHLRHHLRCHERIQGIWLIQVHSPGPSSCFLRQCKPRKNAEQMFTVHHPTHQQY